jgi:predicted flap endonuclease-1-like 5' DNA nuclease
MAALSCCLWWFLGGVLLGWLANWLLGWLWGGGGRGAGGGDASTPRAPSVHAPPASAPQASAGATARVDAALTIDHSEAPAPPSAIHHLLTPAHASALHRLITTPAAATTPYLAPTEMHMSSAAASRHATSSGGTPDDLTIIEGIGPKIAELLRQHGVETFAALAAMAPAALQAILDKGGSRFRMAVPDTWPEQALLAGQARWSELKALQETMRAGIRPES